MKHLLVISSILTMLTAISCNRNEDRGSVGRQGEIQKEESVPVDQFDEAQLEENRGGQMPGFEKERNQNKDTITEPIDERPDLQQDRLELNDEKEN